MDSGKLGVCAISKNWFFTAFFFTLIFTFFNINCYSQTDTLKERYLKKIISFQEKEQMDSCLISLKQAVDLIEPTEETGSLPRLYDDLGRYAFSKNKFEQAQYWFKKRIASIPQEENPDLVTNYIALSLTFLERGFADSAKVYIELAQKMWKTHPDSTVLTNLENNTGRVYMDVGDFASSLDHYLKALPNAEREYDTINLILIYLNMGTLYQRMEKYDDALEYYLTSLKLSQLINYLKGISASYSIGIIYRQRGEFDKALKYYTIAIPACEKLGALDDLANIYNNISNVYMQTKKYEEASNILHKSIKLSKSEGNQRQLGIGYANLGKTFELMKQYDSSVYYLTKAEALFDKLGAKNLKSIAIRLISGTYESEHNYEKAFEFYVRHVELADSIMNEKVEGQIAELKTRYETEKTESEVRILKKEIRFEKEKTYFLMFLAVILILMGMISLVLFYFIRKNAVTKKLLAESVTARLASELEFKRRELTIGALALSRNLEFANSLIVDLQELADFVNEDGLHALNNIVNKLSKQQSDASWKEFEKRFSEIHSDFYTRLLDQYPDLSPNEIKLSALLRLGMNTKEICSITFQSVRAVEAGRLRLRKKLVLPNSENLSMFLQKF